LRLLIFMCPANVIIIIQCLLTLCGLIITAEQRTIIHYSNTVIGTPAVDGWGVTFGTARRGLGEKLSFNFISIHTVTVAIVL